MLIKKKTLKTYLLLIRLSRTLVKKTVNKKNNNLARFFH